MNGLIRASLKNPIAVTVMMLALAVLGGLAAFVIPIDILPVFRSPAVQTLVFYGGMPADAVAEEITLRMERWTGQAVGMKRQESRSINGTTKCVPAYSVPGRTPESWLIRTAPCPSGTTTMLDPTNPISAAIATSFAADFIRITRLGRLGTTIGPGVPLGSVAFSGRAPPRRTRSSS